MRALSGLILLALGMSMVACKQRHEKVDHRSGGGDSTDFDEIATEGSTVPDDPGAEGAVDDSSDATGASNGSTGNVCPEDVKLVCVEDGEGGFVEIALGRQGAECQFVVPDGIKEVAVEKCKSM